MRFKVLQRIQIVLFIVFLVTHLLLQIFNFHPELLLALTLGMTFLENDRSSLFLFSCLVLMTLSTVLYFIASIT
ncbi:hypothetical protein [Ligilactobacillus faecis]|uniref:Uncharacterized protein n=1 Tax=Ligilactobacillus faecis TaxID=762833 RepID=A0ABV4DT59_9LACO|nr:hypothetical protein [Ligilactobacillus faecis]WGN90464.1 hypothetical protein QFX10_05230 [Ligilactobacillus faecis]